MTYLTYAEGFKSGTSVIGEAGKEFVDPEKVDSIELGLKSQLLDNQLQLNVAVFYHEVEDAQFQFTFPQAAPPNFTTEMRNAAQIEGKGVELEARLAATRAFSLDASIAWLDSSSRRSSRRIRLMRPDTAPLPDRRRSRTSAAIRTRMSPEWSDTVHPVIRVPARQRRLAGPGGQRRSTRASSTTRSSMTTDGLGRLHHGRCQPSVHLARSAGHVNLWAKNLTDELVWAGSYAVASTRTIGGTLMPPRTYGVTLGVRF